MNASTPRYQNIAEDLTRRIIDEGEWPPESKLPTEADLTKEYDTSITTIRNALRTLAESGLVEVRRGSGTWVTSTARFFLMQSSFQKLESREGITREGAWATEVRAQGYEPTTRFSCLSSLASADLANLLEVTEGSRLVIRRSERFVDERPAAIELGHYPDWLTSELPLLAGPEIIPQGTTSWLAENGYSADHHFDTIEARPTTSDETEFFGEPRTITCLVRQRTTYTATNKPLRTIRTTYKASNHTLGYEVS